MELYLMIIIIICFQFHSAAELATQFFVCFSI